MMLAEISDKMATMPEAWWRMFLLGLPVFFIGLLLSQRHLFVGWILAGIQCALLAKLKIDQAYFAGSFSEAVWKELGGYWVANDIASSLCPLLLMAVAHWLHKKWPSVWEVKDPSEEERGHTEPLHIWR